MEAALKEALKIENFKDSDYNPRYLVDLASRKTASELKISNFDPKPYIRSYESLTEELLRIKRKLSNKIEDQEDQMMAMEVSQRRAFKEFNDLFDDISKSYEVLNARLAEVGNIAVRIGEQLETIDKYRDRAAEAKELIHYFQDFNRGSSEKLMKLRRDGIEGEYKAAIVARRLNTIAKEIGIHGTETAKANIEKFCEEFEKTLLEVFDQVYADNGRKTMNHIARTLMVFNGGNSCIQTYVNQHPFFINLLKIAEADTSEPIVSSTKWIQVKLKSLQKLYDEIRLAIESEWESIYAIFPNANTVIQVFVQRIFAQSIQNFLEILLQEGLGRSAQVYLDLLCQSHYETSLLVSDMHNFDTTVIVNSSGSPALASMLDRSMEDLYIPYIGEQRYLSVEKQWLIENFEMNLSKFNEALQYVPSRKKGKRGSIILPGTSKDASMVVSNLFSTVATTVNTMTSELKQHYVAGQDQVKQMPDYERYLVPSLDVATLCVQVTHISLERTKELVRSADLPNVVVSLFKMLFDKLGPSYLLIALDLVLEKMAFSEMHKHTEPEIGHFSIIKTTQQIVQLVNLHFQSYEGLVKTTSPSCHRDLTSLKTEFTSKIESKLNMIVQKRLVTSVTWIETILSRQKRADYNIKDVQNTVATLTCTTVSEFLKTISGEAFDFLDESNRDSYLHEVGVSLCKLLLDHIKRFYYTYSGGLVLSTDITRLHEVVIAFRVESLNEYFSVLKELSNLYIVKPENLKMVLQEGYLGRMDLAALHSYLCLRADWSKLARIEKEFFNQQHKAKAASSVSSLNK